MQKAELQKEKLGNFSQLPIQHTELRPLEVYRDAVNSLSTLKGTKNKPNNIDKVVLYNMAFDKCKILNNPAIQLLISGNEQINSFMKIKDHKIYADAILKDNMQDWRDNFNFFKKSVEVQEGLNNNTLTQEMVSDLEDLVEQYYTLPDDERGLDDQLRPFVELPAVKYHEKTSKLKAIRRKEYVNAAENIHMIWQGLVRQTPQKSNSTLIPMPNPYVVPGGRFREIYYWDSYFTILGLKCSGLNKLAKGMVENLFYLVEQFGFVPNGNRTYYVSRSQPPFLALMADTVKPKDLSTSENKQWLKHAYKVVSHEYFNNWMDSKSHYISEVGLNRYYDAIDKKRPECFGEDNCGATIEEGYFQHERAECASGMDFTARFSQRACDFAPVDLNCLLYKYEIILGEWASLLGKGRDSEKWLKIAQKRKNNIMKYMYNESDGLFYDYDHKNKQQSSFKSIASIFPMWTKMIDEDLSESLRDAIVNNFETNGGVLTSATVMSENTENNCKSCEEYQWDAPNGWAPMQLIAVEALKNYGYKWDAKRITTKWLNLTTDIFNYTGKFFEKYNIIENNIEVNTCYPQQEGFGWTNGVYLEMLTEILPELESYP